MPSRTHPQLIGSLCDRLATVGKLQLVEALELADLNAPRQASLNNSVRQATNAVELFRISEAYPNCEFPSGPCLLVDDTMQSGWTMTAATELLRGAGATAVLPLVVWRRP
jgi:ATP-dependent DNA helicase RecQ